LSSGGRLQMSKRVVVSLIIIAVLLLLLVIGKRRKTVDVPEIKKWEGTAEEILISKGDSRVRIFKKNGKWVLNEQEYLADKTAVEKLEKKINEIKVIDLISEKPHYGRYDLDDEKAIRVIATKDGVPQRDLRIGKKSSTGMQTYVKFSDRPEIYLISGKLTDDFGKKVSDLRDKVIFKVVKSGIESLRLTYKGEKLTFLKIKEEVKEEKAVDEGKKEDKKGKKVKEVEKWICKEYKGLKLNENTIDSILNSFNPLKADTFTDRNKDSLRNPACTVKLKAYKKDILLSIFGKSKEKEYSYLCTSSESPYVFTMSKWDVEKYFKTIGDFKKK
jgi:hypothetical protein